MPNTGSEMEDPSCNIPKVVDLIKNLKNVRAFGLFLKIDSGRLDEMEKSHFTDRRTQIVREWFKHPMDDADRWEELDRVLLEPAIHEPRIARRIRLLHRRFSSVDSATSGSPTLSSPHYEIGK